MKHSDLGSKCRAKYVHLYMQSLHFTRLKISKLSMISNHQCMIWNHTQCMIWNVMLPLIMMPNGQKGDKFNVLQKLELSKAT